MTDGDDGWGAPDPYVTAPLRVPPGRRHESWDPPTPAYGTPTVSRPPAGRIPPRPPKASIAAGLIAGATALAVALAGGTVVIDHNKSPLSWAGQPGAAAATDTGKTGNPAPPKRSTAPAPVLSVPAVTALVNPGVVVINSQLGYQAEAAGTGMVLSPNGVILTNNHVIANATRISVTVVSTQRHYVADVVGTAASSDVAVLQLEGATGLAAVPLDNSDSVTKGQSVVAIGNAGGSGSLSVVTGTVTSTNRPITASDQHGGSSERLTGMIEVLAPIRAGDSGGPLANRAGKVIGMDTAASVLQRSTPGAHTYGYAIPINRALAVADSLRRASNRGYLGVNVEPANPQANSGGAQVIATTPNSPAEVAGVQAGDTITELNGEPVTSADSLTKSLSKSKPGQQVSLGWVDQFGEAHRAVVKLVGRPTD